MERLSYEFVKKEFEKEGYKLLTKTYINAHQKLKYICPQGHWHHISQANWKKGARCPYCAQRPPITVEFIRSEFKKEDYVFLTKTYKNAHQKLNYSCPKNHYHSISWSGWKQGQRCPHCDGQGKPTIEFIKKELEKEGYKLSSKKYINSQQKLKYICPNGHKHSITWNNWQQGRKCPYCHYEKLSTLFSGKNHPSWKGGISCEPYCQDWTKEFKDYIKERDGYKCLNPGCWGNCNHLPLTIHHIDYNKKNCEPQNLITLCRSCNSRANKDRKWHTVWYQAIMNKKFIKEKSLIYYTGG